MKRTATEDARKDMIYGEAESIHNMPNIVNWTGLIVTWPEPDSYCSTIVFVLCIVSLG